MLYESKFWNNYIYYLNENISLAVYSVDLTHLEFEPRA